MNQNQTAIPVIKPYPSPGDEANRTPSVLSFEQQHLWNKRVPNIPPMAVRFRGPLNVAEFRTALFAIAQRHEALRTVFRDGPTPEQVILPDLHIDFLFRDLSDITEEKRRSAADQVILSEAARPFDIYQGPLIRAGLLRLSDDEHYFFFTIHHIVTDLWSFRVFFRDLGLLYSANIRREPSPLPTLTIQYSDYAAWQKQRFQGEMLDEYIMYWKPRLSGTSPLQLHTDHPRPNQMGGQGRVESIRISRPTVESLRTVCRSQRVTPFILLLAAFNLLLHKRTGELDIAVSTLVANRSLPGIESLVGVFANRLVLRTTLEPSKSFQDFLRDVRDVCFGAYEHQDLSFWKIAPMIPPSASAWSSMILFTLQDVPVRLPHFEGLEVSPLHLTGPTMFENTGMAITGRFDQSWEVWRDGEELIITVSYPPELFEQSTIRNLLIAFRDILDRLAGSLTLPLHHFSEPEGISPELEKMITSDHCVTPLEIRETRIEPGPIPV